MVLQEIEDEDIKDGWKRISCLTISLRPYQFLEDGATAVTEKYFVIKERMLQERMDGVQALRPCHMKDESLEEDVDHYAQQESFWNLMQSWR